MSNNIIDGALNYLGNLETVADIKYIQKTGNSLTIPANSGRSLNNAEYGTPPDIPQGYQSLLYGAKVDGASSVVPCGLNSYWVQNTSTSSATCTAIFWRVVIKKN